MGLIIDMQPFGAPGAGGGGHQPHERGGYAAAAELRMDGRIEQESVRAAIPGDVDEADQAGIDAGGGVAKAAVENFGVTGPQRRTPGDKPERREVGVSGKTVELEDRRLAQSFSRKTSLASPAA